ncbi:hypothetical protein ACHAXR_004119, partial [Thalassiosira sp. AJA248-18]
QPITSIVHPIQHAIRARHSQCIYARFERGNFATFEIFIVDADIDGKPAAAIQIEGPVASPKVGQLNEAGERSWDHNPEKEVLEGRSKIKRKTNTMGAAMQDSIDNWPAFVATNAQHFTEAGIIHHAFFIDYTHSGENEDAIAARADISRQKSEENEERRRQRDLEHERRRREEGGEYKGDENIDDEIYEEETGKIQHIVPESIEPYEWTKPIKASGWYRMCVQTENSITVEMDIRSSADLGGIDPETWHVYTHDEREAIDEEERIMELKNREPSADEVEAKLVAEELEKALQNQVGDFDLEETKNLMTEVNRLVSQLQSKQQNVHHRIKGHENDARRNYKRIVRSGWIETALYIVITLFQVYTVRKWLLSKNVLG